jgi:FkbM family methyltransferase
LGTRHRIRNYGLTFDTRDPAITPQVEAQLFWQIYESAEIRFARRYLADCPTVIDLGSIALDVMAHDGRLISVEANPKLLKSLRRNLAAHAGDREFVVVHAAIAYGAPCAHLESHGQTLGGKISVDGGGVEVPATTLADLLTDHQVGRYALLADIEGAERDMLEHDSLALERCDCAVVELHETPRASVDALIQSFATVDLVLVDRRGPVVALKRRD